MNLCYDLETSCTVFCISGTVKENLGNCAYLVQDSTDALEKIWREDILAESDDADFILEVCVFMCKIQCI